MLHLYRAGVTAAVVPFVLARAPASRFSVPQAPSAQTILLMAPGMFACRALLVLPITSCRSLARALLEMVPAKASILLSIRLTVQTMRCRFALDLLTIALLGVSCATNAVLEGMARAIAKLLRSQVQAAIWFRMLAEEATSFSKLHLASLRAATVFALRCAESMCFVVLWVQAATALGATMALLLTMVECAILISRCVALQEQLASTLPLLTLYSRFLLYTSLCLASWLPFVACPIYWPRALNLQMVSFASVYRLAESRRQPLLSMCRFLVAT